MGVYMFSSQIVSVRKKRIFVASYDDERRYNCVDPSQKVTTIVSRSLLLRQEYLLLVVVHLTTVLWSTSTSLFSHIKHVAKNNMLPRPHLVGDSYYASPVILRKTSFI